MPHKRPYMLTRKKIFLLTLTLGRRYENMHFIYFYFLFLFYVFEDLSGFIKQFMNWAVSLLRIFQVRQ